MAELRDSENKKDEKCNHSSWEVIKFLHENFTSHFQIRSNENLSLTLTETVDLE